MICLRLIAETPEEARPQPGQHEEGDEACAEEDQRLAGEGREDQAERDDGGQIGDEAGGQHDLAVVRGVEAEFEHHRIDDGDRGGRHGDAGQPAGLVRPAQAPARQPQPQRGLRPDFGHASASPSTPNSTAVRT